MGHKARSAASTSRKTTRRGATAARSSKISARPAPRPSAPRTLQALLECGGEADCAEDLAALLEMSRSVLVAMRDKRAATHLLATPARLRLPARRRRGATDGDAD